MEGGVQKELVRGGNAMAVCGGNSHGAWIVGADTATRMRQVLYIGRCCTCHFSVLSSPSKLSDMFCSALCLRCVYRCLPIMSLIE